jgi:energy-coupling factor transporter ATP-binding protein EcfA2
VLTATHNAAIVDRLRRRVIRMEDGKVVSDEDRGYYFLGDVTHGLGQTHLLP